MPSSYLVSTRTVEKNSCSAIDSTCNLVTPSRACTAWFCQLLTVLLRITRQSHSASAHLRMHFAVKGTISIREFVLASKRLPARGLVVEVALACLTMTVVILPQSPMNRLPISSPFPHLWICRAVSHWTNSCRGLSFPSHRRCGAHKKWPWHQATAILLVNRDICVTCA